MLSKPGDLEFGPRPRIPLRFIILAYKSSYGGGSHSTDQWPKWRGPGWHAAGGMESDKVPLPLLYHLGFIVKLTDSVPPTVSIVYDSICTCIVLYGSICSLT
jgi:hypothetical protein